MNNIRKKTSEQFHIFFTFFALTAGFESTEFLPNPNRDANHYATEHLHRFVVMSCPF